MRTLLALLTAVVVCVPAFAETREEALRAAVRRLPPVEQGFVDRAKYVGHYSLSELVTYSNRDGRLAATFHLPERLVRQFADPAPLLVSLEGSPHVWSLHRRKAATLDAGFSMLTLTCYAPDEVWPFNRFAVSSDGGQTVLVSAGQMFGNPAAQQTLTMGQTERSLWMAWRLDADKWVSKRVEAADMKELPTRTPAIIIDRYLLPVLRRLGAARAASDVYRVFDQVSADPAVTKRVMPLLAGLDSDDSAVRDAAAAGLKAMGRPAVLACMRMDQASLSPEQRGRLAGFYAAEGWMRVADVEAARGDEGFLASCTEDEDPAVRAAASNLLAAARTARQLRR